MSGSPLRRTAVALAGIAVSATILRPQLSDALVARGDELLYRARPEAALHYYDRAIALDGDDAAAADRYAFVALTLRKRPALDRAVSATSAYLRRHPLDDAVRMDRALAYRARGDLGAALDDFARVGASQNDPRALAFAGYCALRIGRPELARRYWRAALAVRPDFFPARRALERHR